MLRGGLDDGAPPRREFAGRIRPYREGPRSIPGFLLPQCRQTACDGFAVVGMELERARAGAVHDGHQMLILTLDVLADHAAQMQQMQAFVGADASGCIERVGAAPIATDTWKGYSAKRRRCASVVLTVITALSPVAGNRCRQIIQVSCAMSDTAPRPGGSPFSGVVVDQRFRRARLVAGLGRLWCGRLAGTLPVGGAAVPPEPSLRLRLSAIGKAG